MRPDARLGLAACGLLACASLACGGEPDPSTPIERVPFRHHVIDAAPPSGEECCTDVLALGDLDRDGRLDVVLGAENAPAEGLAWYRAPDWERHAIADGNFTTDAQVADVDGDGWPDVVASRLDRGIWWYANPGSDLGRDDIRRWEAHAVGPGRAHDLEVGDVDGDGCADLVIGDKASVFAFLCRPGGAWQRQVLRERAGEGIALGDLDRDGDLDVVYGGEWLENPGRAEAASGAWPVHPIADSWPDRTRARIADLDGDGRVDVVLSSSEDEGDLAWFAAPADPRNGPWPRHPIDRDLVGAHSLRLSDLDGDSTLDVVTAEMHTSDEKRVLAYFRDGEGWFRQLVAATGSHNLRVGDVDGDGDVDLVGKNYAGPARPLEWWENMRTGLRSLDRWEYHAIDTDRPRSDITKTGLVFGDLNRDGYDDVVAGAHVYLNPEGDLTAPWRRVALDPDLDVFFALDVDGDDLADLVAMSGDGVFRLEALDASATAFRRERVATVPDARTQGYAAGQLFAGGPPELVFTRGQNLFALLPPESGETSWRLLQLADDTEEEGLALVDLDGDGDLDVAATDDSGDEAIWLENPGSAETGWRRHDVGSSEEWLDRVASADVDGDGLPDIIVSEETRDAKRNARVWWFHNAGGGHWERRPIGTFRSANSLGVADLDGDGDPDVAVAEHTDLWEESKVTDNLTVVFENQGGGAAWVPHVVEQGPHSSHLGARLRDLDRDGDLDLVSVGWGQYQDVHLWINRSEQEPPARR